MQTFDHATTFFRLPSALFSGVVETFVRYVKAFSISQLRIVFRKGRLNVEGKLSSGPSSYKTCVIDGCDRNYSVTDVNSKHNNSGNDPLFASVGQHLLIVVRL
jgi:hypothetical protein